jgi:Mg/Co/Ni transporter MgtE
VLFTMEDFNRQYIKQHFAQLTPEEQREALQAISPEKRKEVLQALLPGERKEVLQALLPGSKRKYSRRYRRRNAWPVCPQRRSGSISTD